MTAHDTIIPYKLKKIIGTNLETIIYKLGNKNSSNVANLGYGYKLIKNKMSKGGCQFTNLVKFEGSMFHIFNGIERHLIINYGDYMKLPPVENRIARHAYYKLSHEKSYKEYEEYEEQF